jgi:hypothetical protein
MSYFNIQWVAAEGTAVQVHDKILYVHADLSVSKLKKLEKRFPAEDFDLRLVDSFSAKNGSLVANYSGPEGLAVQIPWANVISAGI